MLCIISGTNREASNSQQSTTTSAHPINQQKKLVGKQRYRQESKSNTKPLQIGNTEEKKDSKKSKVYINKRPNVQNTKRVVTPPTKHLKEVAQISIIICVVYHFLPRMREVNEWLLAMSSRPGFSGFVEMLVSHPSSPPTVSIPSTAFE